MTSEAQKRAMQKYQKKLKRIPLDIKRDDYEKLKEFADAAGESVNGYIRRSLQIRMDVEREAVSEQLNKKPPIRSASPDRR